MKHSKKLTKKLRCKVYAEYIQCGDSKKMTFERFVAIRNKVLYNVV